MRRFDKRKNIMEANLRLEREFITSKNILLNTTRSSTFIEACLNSQYFDEDEKSFIIESVLPNQKLIQEGGWDWFKEKVIDPAKNLAAKGVDKMKSFFNKIKTLLSNIGKFFKQIWAHIVKFGTWLWDKVMGMVKSKMNKYKNKIKSDFESFKNLPPQERDTEVKQIEQTAKFWRTASGLGPLYDMVQEEVAGAINSFDNKADDLIEESWSSGVIDFFSKNKKILKESGEDEKTKNWLVKAITWVLKAPIKALEWVFSKVTQGVLIVCSFFTKKVGGPGFFKFKHLSHLLGATLFTIFEGIVASHALFGTHFEKNFITDVIEGWEHIIEGVLGSVAGHFVHPLVVIISVIGIVLGVVEMIHAFKHMFKEKDLSQYEKGDLNKDGKVDDAEKENIKKGERDAYYQMPG